ncbi:hypothetical protein LAT59_00120 [Candidatus Gracilibacteria bacterium]|nr:hypothetical protein [Candidatus Gracilibacteria bacterium]
MLLRDNKEMKQEIYSLSRLKNYAEWYYFRYYPSNEKLLQKLREKGSEEDVLKVYEYIFPLTQEEAILETKIEGYILRNKNFRYIEQKMREKLFPKEKVKVYLKQYRDTGESLYKEEYLRKKIEYYIEKGKSKQYIFGKLGETKEDKYLLEHIFEKYFEDGEGEALKKEYEKIKGKSDKQKIIQKLLMKGFRYDDIKKLLS